MTLGMAEGRTLPIGISSTQDRGAAPIAFAFVLSTALVIFVGFPADDAGPFLGPDSYTRMSRVRDLIETGLHGSALDRVFPSGLDHHWTRLLDLLIAGIALILSASGLVADPVYWAGALIGPALLVGGVTASIWILRPALPSSALHILALLVVLTPIVFLELRIGRTDHHGLELMFVLVLLSLAIRLIEAELRTGRRLAWAAGAFAGLLAWGVSSGILHGVAAIVAFGVLWLIYGGSFAAKGAHVAAAAMLTVLVALPVERGLKPEALLAMEPDRLSLVHAAIFLVLFCGLAGAAFLTETNRSGLRGRLAFSGICGLAGLAAMAAILPKLLFEGRLAKTDRFYGANRGGAIQEYQYIFETADWWTNSAAVVNLSPYIMGTIAFGLGSIFLANRRQVLLFLAVVLIICAGYFFDADRGFHIRALITIVIPSLVVTAIVAGDLTAAIEAAGRWWRWTSLGLQLLIGGSLAVISYAVVVTSGNEGRKGTHRASCNIASVLPELRQIAPQAGARAGILAIPETSAQILYLTDYHVFAIPTHRDQPGFRAMIEIMRSSDHDAAIARAREMGIVAIVTCAGEGFYSKNDPSSLLESLQNQEGPSGVVPLTDRDDAVQVHRISDDSASSRTAE